MQEFLVGGACAPVARDSSYEMLHVFCTFSSSPMKVTVLASPFSLPEVFGRTLYSFLRICLTPSIGHRILTYCCIFIALIALHWIQSSYHETIDSLATNLHPSPISITSILHYSNKLLENHF